MKSIYVLLLSVCLGPALADNNRDSSVETWLEIQRQGTQASSIIQSATAAERERSAVRWLKTFEQEIPAKFISDEFGSD